MINWYTLETSSADTNSTARADAGEWEGFTQLALRTSSAIAVAVIRATVDGWLADEATQDTHTLCFCEHGEWVLIGEPGVDLDARIINALSAEMIAQYAELDAIFFGHDPLTGTMQLSVMHEGDVQLRWEDSLDPLGCNEALLFHTDGRCTYEDSRRFALRELNLPAETSWLDRHAFLEFALHARGLHVLDPHLAHQPLVHALHAIDLNA